MRHSSALITLTAASLLAMASLSACGDDSANDSAQPGDTEASADTDGGEPDSSATTPASEVTEGDTSQFAQYFPGGVVPPEVVVDGFSMKILTNDIRAFWQSQGYTIEGKYMALVNEELRCAFTSGAEIEPGAWASVIQCGDFADTYLL